MRIHQGDEKVKLEVLKAISNSWNHFKNTLEGYSITLRETDRRTRHILSILGIFMLLNSLRTFTFEIPTERMRWGSLILLIRELPLYLFLLTGFLLMSIQSQRWGKRPLESFNAELDAIFSDVEEAQEALDNEFDPIE